MEMIFYLQVGQKLMLNYLREQNVNIIVQVNGKKRAELSYASQAHKKNLSKNWHLKLIVSSVQTSDKTIRKIIYVPNRLLNIVAN